MLSAPRLPPTAHFEKANDSPMSGFLGLEIGRRALSASQTALDVTGQNIANVNTPGYSRQIANLQTTEPLGVGRLSGLSDHLGTGVAVASVSRVRDQFLDKQIRNALADQGSHSTLQNLIKRVESALNEPSDNGLSSRITRFFNSFSDLSANPESAGIRANVRSNAEALTEGVRSLNATLDELQSDIQTQVKAKIGTVNDLAKQIAELNQQIQTGAVGGGSPNDLMDKRDGLLEKLSGIVGIQVHQSVNSQTKAPIGEITVSIGGYALIMNNHFSPLPETVSAEGDSFALVSESGERAEIKSGELFGLLKAEKGVGGYQSALNTFTQSLIQSVNTQHAAGAGLDGSTGVPFFAGTDSHNIALSSAVQNDLNAIAAATPPTPPNTVAQGNGDNARALARLAFAPVINQKSLGEFYNAQVATIGADSQRYQNAVQSQEQVLSQLRNQQSSTSGVSLDEELTRLIQYQRSYQAAARLISVMDQSLELIVTRLGA